MGDGNSLLTLYCNGKYLGKVDQTYLNIQNSILQVGGIGFEPQGNFGGCVNYVEVWDYALSSTEVASLFKPAKEDNHVFYRITPNAAHFDRGYVHSTNFDASKCIDGQFDTTCHSDLGGDQLHIDIPLSRISMVKLHNRKVCCQDRIIGAVVSVDGVVCGKIETDAMITDVFCPDVPGTRVTISQPGDTYINLDQVEVFGIHA